MPAAMHRHAVDDVRAIKLPAIFGALLPRRVIRKRRHHLDVVPARAQEFTKRDIMRRDARELRRVVDAPDDDSHQLTRARFSSTARTSSPPRGTHTSHGA